MLIKILIGVILAVFVVALVILFVGPFMGFNDLPSGEDEKHKN